MAIGLDGIGLIRPSRGQAGPARSQAWGDTAMTIEEILDRAGDQVGVRRVFGEPIEQDGVIVVPVAMVMGGGGGGTGPGSDGEEAAGGGFGVWARGIGVYEIRDGRVRFVPAVDVVVIGLLSMALVRTVSRALRRARRHR
jgi:uncharacterized spore protein YtfJ